MSILLLIVGLVLFIGLVVVHEYGHFIAARRNGIEVEEFGVGFPPRARLLTKRHGTEYTLNWLPLGGFVRLKGEHDADTEAGSFGAASLPAKVKVMVAGVLMNLITALVLFTLLALVGMPKVIANQFTVKSDERITQRAQNEGVVVAEMVVKGSPAAKSGLQNGDRIVSIAGVTIDSPEVLSGTTKANAGRTVTVQLERRGKPLTIRPTLNKTSQEGYLGVQPETMQKGMTIRRYTWSAPVVAVGTTVQFTKVTFKGLGTVLKGTGSLIAGALTGNREARQSGQRDATGNVSGVVGIFFILNEVSKMGVLFILFVLAILSLTLAIMNVLPIPALDGGRLFVTLLFRAVRQPLTQKREELIHGSGFAFLMLLFVLITIVDIKRFF